MSAFFRRTAVLATAVLVFSVPVRAQETGHGDVFGDLVHILRNPTTGQPILQKRQVLLPQDVLGIAYCPVPIDVNGVELPFVDLSCDVVDTELGRVVPVDYFGRLSGGRTRERNLRMHFDEVILTIQEAEVITLDPAGRLKFGTGCLLSPPPEVRPHPDRPPRGRHVVPRRPGARHRLPSGAARGGLGQVHRRPDRAPAAQLGKPVLQRHELRGGLRDAAVADR